MNKLRIFLALVLTVVTLSHSKPSQAAVGLAFSTPVLIAGLVVGGAGVIGTGLGLHKCNQSPSDEAALCGLVVVVLGAPVVLLGLVVLEGEQDIAFRELSPAEGMKLGISSGELSVYNSEVDQANMLLSDVQTELSKIEKPSAQDSIAAWSAVRDLVSPATYTVMQKIASQK